ncbi:retrotransposon protein, putative, ty1-copia subclass [Tanacetum coccineum]
MTAELHRQFENSSPYDMIKELKAMFEKQAGVERFDLIQPFHACKQEEGKPVAAYIIQMKGYVDQLECLGYVLQQDLIVVGKLHAMLIEHEKGLPKKAETPQVMMIKGGKIQKANKKSLKVIGNGKANRKGKDKHVYIPKPKNPKPSTKEHPAKDDACHHCKEVGHWKRNCHVYLAVLLKKKKRVGSANSSGIFTIELFAFLNKSWVYDTGGGANICITKHVFREVRKLKQEALYLYVGNGVHAQMTRKSFPHHPERATDLLGIIYSDVCGPLRHVSKQGASYFITFTDDYSHYGYVYLLKLKHKQLTPPYTPQHNGVSERRNCTLLDMVQSMMNLTTMPSGDVRRYTLDKLQQRSVKCIFIGYPKEMMGYYFYFPPKNKIVVARYAEFFEKNLITQEVSGRDMDLEEIHDEDTSPSEIISEIPMEVEGFEPPQEEEILIRRSERTRQAPNHLCLNIKAGEYSLGDLNEPTSCKAAMLDSESNKWIDAMNAEIQSMMDNMVWVLVDLPPGCKTIGSKCIFKKKTNMDGIVHTYKARLIAKGYTQLYGVDYEETFSPVTDIRAIRILISIATYYDYEIWQMDIKTAFLNGYLDEDIYMVQPEGFVDPNPKKDLGEAAFILGIKFYRDRSKRLIRLGQNAYIDKILKIYKMDNSKRGHIPMQERLDLNKTQGASTPEEVKRMQNISYALAVGSIIDDTKSQTRYFFILNGGAVDWKSSKQSTTAMSAI